MMITFHQPLWIAAGFVCCLIIWVLWRRYERIRATRLSRFAAESLMPALTANVSPFRRSLKKWLLLLSVLLCFIALARPQYGHRWVDVKHRGIDILFALDTSKSMLAEDVRPNRLERSKLAVLDFVSKLTGDRVGLMPFAGTSYLMCPLTADYHAFEQSLTAVDHTIIPHGGTNIDSAIDGALAVLAATSNYKILIVITDGEQLHGNAADAAKRAAENNMIVYTVGVGTEHGELIPDLKTGGFVQDGSGTYVKSRLDRKNLQAVAQTTGGLYADLGDHGQGLETIYRQKLALVPQTELAEKRKQVPIERFGWPLALALFLMSIELLLSERKTERNGTLSVLNRIAARFGKAAAMAVFLYGTAAAPSNLHASEAEEAYAGYHSGKFIEAGEKYRELLAKNPDNPQVIFNSGTTAYKNNLFEDAAEAFDRALASDDLQLQEKAYFNRGNAFYRLGEAAMQAQPDQTIVQWERAVASYLAVLALNPDNEQAAANQAYVKEKLEQLKQQHSEQKSRQDQKQGEQNDEQSDGGENTGNDRSADQQDNQKSSGSADSGDQNRQQNNESGKQQQDEESTSGKPKPSEQTAQSGTDESSGDRQTAADGAAQTSAGRLSREEALQLLQAMKAEEGRIDLYAPLDEKQHLPTQDW